MILIAANRVLLTFYVTPDDALTAHSVTHNVRLNKTPQRQAGKKVWLQRTVRPELPVLLTFTWLRYPRVPPSLTKLPFKAMYVFGCQKK